MTHDDLFRPRPVQIAEMHRDQFPDDFLSYLPNNLHVYGAFCREALKVISRGFNHYSARTIVEVLRHHSAIAEKPASDYKLNDKFTPYLSRLWMLEYPQYQGFFELRVAKKVFTELSKTA